jgi:hypothetical protein
MAIFFYWDCYFFILWSRILPDPLIVTLLDKEFPAFYLTRVQVSRSVDLNLGPHFFKVNIDVVLSYVPVSSVYIFFTIIL